MEKKPSHVEMVTVQATAGMVAGACSSVITTPIDTVKTRLQVMTFRIGMKSRLSILLLYPTHKRLKTLFDVAFYLF